VKQERLHFAAYIIVPGTGASQEFAEVRGVLLEGRGINLFYSLPAFPSQSRPPWS
jgi:hypothetical protein